MAETTNTPSSEDIWDLNIDDLLAPLPEKARLGGRGPFVINLSASYAPIDLPAKGITGFGNTHVYQMQRIEDGRPRYRLRLGSFANEDEADAALPKVREIYPSALTATADADDLRTIAALRAKAPASQPIAERPAERPAEPMVKAVVEAAVKPAAPLTPAAAKSPSAAAAAAVAPRLITPQQKAAVLVRASVPAPAPPSIESTQTMRSLTQLEVEDDQASRWFAIQLSLAEEPFDPETLPNLDIFSVYRLYSVAGIDNGRIVHALRLGFFTEQTAAGAVASYLTAFYDKPAIKRVSASERERFADQSLQARKDVGATGKQAVIEITNERYIREKRVGQGAGKSAV
jgi:hypothetical protein